MIVNVVVLTLTLTFYVGYRCGQRTGYKKNIQGSCKNNNTRLNQDILDQIKEL